MSDLAQQAAEITTRKLNVSINRYGSATWVLAGGTSPLSAYKIIAKQYIDKVDWQKVTVLIGDERCVPPNHPDSNWKQISKVLLSRLPILASNQYRPDSTLAIKDMATHYEKVLSNLPKTKNGLPRLDCLWLGIGEDGHTLSMFPGQEAVWKADNLVVAVYNSPKPPPERISLSLKTLGGVSSCLVLASGEAKNAVATRAQHGDMTLPITRAVHTIESAGGSVQWLMD